MSKHSRLIILPLLFLPLLFLFPLSAQEDVATALYKEGLKKYILEDYIGAIKDFESAYRIAPEDIKIRKMYRNTLIKQGNIEYENNNLESAKDYFIRAYNLSTEDEELKQNLEMIQAKIDEQKQEIALEEPPRETPAEETEQLAQISQEEKERRAEKLAEVQLPFDIDAFIQQQNLENKNLLREMIEAQREERQTFMKNIEENQKILDDSIKAQRDERETLLKSIEENQKLMEQNIRTQSKERETFLKNLIEISRSQTEDRMLFSRMLAILVGGSISIAVILFLSFLVLLKRRAKAAARTLSYDQQTALEFNTKALLEYPKEIDDTQYLKDENYSEIVRTKRLSELYHELRSGNVTWDVIQGYISELDHELKSEILNIVEKKLASGETAGRESAFEILLPFVTDGEVEIGARSKKMLKMAAADEEASHRMPPGSEEPEDSEDPLGYSSLLQLARMADTKTGRTDHSLHVSEVSFKIAQKLDLSELDPDIVKRVALVHDIGYLELDDRILKKEGKLTQRQFLIIKTHAARGLNLLQHVQLPQAFVDGIKHHHERLDGSGYPDGLKKEEIPLIARILAVADFFDAITSARPYRPALTIASGLRMMEKLADEIFDRNVFEGLEELYKEQLDGGV